MPPLRSHVHTTSGTRRRTLMSSDALAWSRLRAPRKQPQCVVDSIPAEDMYSYLRLVASNPLLPFPGASAINNKLLGIREWRGQPSPPSGPSLKRHRVGDFSDVEVALSDALANGRASSDEQGPPRRKRRSTRPVSTTRAIPAAAKQAVRKSRGKPPRIAPEFQADVVPHPVLDAAMTTSESWVLSPCVFSPAMCGGNEIVTRFLDRINGEMVCRDGFPLTPVAMEIALVSLAGNKGRINAAITSALPQIPRGLFFPGAGKPWQHAETSLFVRALAERAKNFHYVSRHILTNRTTKELVITYYTYYKQQCYQNGGPKQGFIFDDGGRDASVGRTFLGQTRKVTALRNLAVTAGDGFPADQRMADAVLEFRNFSAVQARKKREEQNRRLSTGFQF